MIRTFRVSGRYDGNRFTLDDVVGSLLAQRELIRTGLMALPELDRAVSIEDVSLVVEKLHTSSLVWDILVEVKAVYQDDLEAVVVGGIEEMFGVDIPPRYEALVTLLALAATYTVARYAYERVARAKGDGQPSVHISGENNTVVQTLGTVVNQPPEAVQAALDRAITPARRRSLIPRVADFFRPARRQEGEPILLDGAPPVSPEALREFPADAALEAINDSSNIDVIGALLEIRAMDRDRLKTGWWALIRDDERFPKRLPMDIYPTIRPESLAAHRFIRANVMVECEIPPEGVLKPRRIHLISYEPAPDPVP